MVDLPPYWIFYPALLILPFAIWLQSQQSLSPQLIFVLSSIVLPAAAGICFRAAGQKVATSLCAVVVLTWYWLPLFIVLLVLMGERASGLVLAAYFAFAAVPVSIFGIVATLSFSRHVSPGWAISAVALAFIPCIILGGLAGEKARSKYRTGPQPADPLMLKDGFLTMNKCIQNFARSNPQKGFPASLEELGPRGNGCLAEQVANGIISDFTVRYEGGAHGAEEPAKSYSLVAMETTPKSKYKSKMYSDESGRIWFLYDAVDTPGRPYFL